MLRLENTRLAQLFRLNYNYLLHAQGRLLGGHSNLKTWQKSIILEKNTLKLIMQFLYLPLLKTFCRRLCLFYMYS